MIQYHSQLLGLSEYDSCFHNFVDMCVCVCVKLSRSIIKERDVVREKDDRNKMLPNEGKPFQENGSIFYWNFSRAAAGTIVKGWRLGEEDNCYFTHVAAVSNATIDGSNATKWQRLEGHGAIKAQREFFKS